MCFLIAICLLRHRSQLPVSAQKPLIPLLSSLQGSFDRFVLAGQDSILTFFGTKAPMSEKIVHEKSHLPGNPCFRGTRICLKQASVPNSSTPNQLIEQNKSFRISSMDDNFPGMPFYTENEFPGNKTPNIKQPPPQQKRHFPQMTCSLPANTGREHIKTPNIYTITTDLILAPSAAASSPASPLSVMSVSIASKSANR